MSSETDEDVAYHAEILMWHDTGHPDFADVAKQYAELFRQHVPDEGDADTIQGKVILATSRLASEYRRNGNINWGPSFEIMVDHLKETLVPAQAEQAEKERVQRNLSLIRENTNQIAEADKMRKAFGECIEDVVRYIQQMVT